MLMEKPWKSLIMLFNKSTLTFRLYHSFTTTLPQSFCRAALYHSLYHSFYHIAAIRRALPQLLPQARAHKNGRPFLFDLSFLSKNEINFIILGRERTRPRQDHRNAFDKQNKVQIQYFFLFLCAGYLGHYTPPCYIKGARAGARAGGEGANDRSFTNPLRLFARKSASVRHSDKRNKTGHRRLSKLFSLRHK